MKKLIAVCMIALLALSCACSFAETASPSELGEGEMYFHGYINSDVNYYVGVPADWALIGLDITPDNERQAYDVLGFTDVEALKKTLSKENNVLFAFSEKGEQMVLTYGASEGVMSDRIAKDIKKLQSLLAAECRGIEFGEDCGTKTLNEILEVCYLSAKYDGNTIYQYYLPAGANIYVFTFVNVDADIAQTVVTTFNIRG